MIYDESYFKARDAAYERNKSYFETEATKLQRRMNEMKERILNIRRERRNFYAHRNDHDPFQIQTSELLCYLSLSKQPRRRTINNANVKFDLELYETLILNGETKYVKDRLIKISDVDVAINARYGFHPQDFKLESSEIPDDVVGLINTKQWPTLLISISGKKPQVRSPNCAIFSETSAAIS
ncbi:uncharacterized protein TRUGW13939_11754 [Talaromyces rugulosus]|uniref:Uncharacterized protein n=1 Tax=Talaromyces rugulosus TaxID=121627 RepID=A0A7H8RDN2_TALRU|nr:uncharacterized protein TRUGW13939_11754 [Talaromyces rugulosus]QKX64579.1 hypothetical protein TRUGW13939_11754 [Talaromyces rugulosus]